MRRAIAIGIIAMHGCAWWGAATVNHSYHECNDEPIFSVIDIVLGSVGAAGLTASGKAEEQPAWLIIPGVFLASGIIGSIAVHYCKKSKSTGIATPATSPGIYVPPPATEDDGPHPIDPLGSPRGPDLRIHEPPIDAPSSEPATCSMQPMQPCPEHQSCRLTDGNKGTCVPE